MKNIRKILAVILCFATLMTVCIPFASAEEFEEGATEITQETPETENPEEEEAETPDESEEDTVIPEEPEEKDTYFECLKHCFDSGLKNIANAGLFAAGTVLSPVVFFVFPPIAVVLGIAGLPVSVLSLFVGIGEILTCPILAFLYDTDDYLYLF